MTARASTTRSKPIDWRWNLFIVWLGQIIAHCAHSFTLPFIPLYMRHRYGLEGEAELGLYVAAYEFFGMMTFCISNPIWGALGDRYGRKLMLLRAYFLNGLTIPLMAVTPSPVWLIAVRALVSCFSGTISAAQALVVATTPEEHHGFALGTLSTALWSGTVMGLLGGGVVVHLWGYQAAFLSCGALLLLCGLMTLFLTRENFVPPEPRTAGADGARPSFGGRSGFSMAIWSLLVLMGLLATARRMDMPFLPILVEIIGGDQNAELHTGYISALAAAGGIISGLLFGALSDRLPAWKLALPALAVSGAAMFLQARSDSLWGLAAMRFICFFAAGGIEPVLLSMLSHITSADRRGAVLGWSASFRVLGGLLGAALSGAVVARFHTRGVFFTAGIIMLLLIPPSAKVLCGRSER